jgi:pimeloyl-ACP methyl ester carboxylesterase
VAAFLDPDKTDNFMRYIFLLNIFLSTNLFGQTEVVQDWNAFVQNFDMTDYQGGQFRLKGFVKVENGNKLTNARLWARVDLEKKKVGFFDNMQNRPIVENVWKEYSIEGTIDKKAVKLAIGGLYFGAGKYYFDNLSLEVKAVGKDWINLNVVNGDFEQANFTDSWKTIFKVKGFESSIVTENINNGKKCLLVDGSRREEKGKFIDANGINIYYETAGIGDTVLLLHGNSMSVSSFSKQIPELSKHFHVISMDSRGQGNSSNNGSKITYEIMAEDVNAFMNKLELKKVNILGWSDGGNIGLILSMKHPDKVKKLATMGANLFNDNTSVQEKINNDLRKQRKVYVDKDAEANKFQIEMIDLLLNEPKINPEELSAIKCKSLIMAGSKDVIKEGHTRLIASKIENSELVIFDKGTHYEPWKNSERFNTTVINFFSKE